MAARKPVIHGRDHLPSGADPVLPGFPTGDTLDEKIMAAGPAAFWKLDETTGLVAHDSSGNGHDLTAYAAGGYTPPTWGQAAGPPGTTTAKWVDATTRVATTTGDTIPAFTDDFTAGVWVNLGELSAFEIIGQGQPIHTPGGWAIMLLHTGPDPGGTFRFSVYVNSTRLDANNPATTGTWYFVAVVRATGTWKLYVDGLLQAATMTVDPGSSGYGANTWLGNDGFLSHTSYLQNTLLSYGFIVDRAMSGTELLGLLDAAESPPVDTTGLVLGIDEDGNVTWVEPKVEVTVNGEPADTTPEPPPDPVPPPDSSGPDGDDWIQDQPFTWGGPEFEVPPNKWTTIPFTTPLMERHSNVTGGSTTWFELDWDDPSAAGWVDPSTPRVITIPHDMEFNPGNFQWFQICLKLEIPPVEDEVFVEGTTTRGSHRGLRVFETTHQKSIVEAYNWRTGSCDGHGALNVFRDPTKHPGLLGDAALFAFGDTGGEHDLEHGNIMLVPNSDYGYYIPGMDWLPGHASGNPTLKKGMRLVPQVWHNAHETLTFDCTGVLPYRPHFVMIVFADRGWGPPWSDWPTSD